MSETNPYNAPGSAVSDAAVAYADPKFFGTGRLGRLRYFGYNVAATIVLYLVLGIAAVLGATVGGGHEASAFIGFLSLIVAVVGIVVSIMLGVQRLHDLDKSGWLWLLYLVPIINILFSLYLLFAPGSVGENQYGLPLKPNGVGVYLMALAAPVLVVGLLVAIAIPSYNDYLERAQQMEQGYMGDGAYSDDAYNR